MMQKYLLIIFTLAIFVSCAEGVDSIPVNDNFLIIGLTYGECGGDCSTFYKLEMDKVYADTEDTWWYSSNSVGFNDEPMNNVTALTEMIKLETDFPDFLVQTEETSFGCPDCGDWGALHVFKNIDGERKYWTLDNALESNPEEIQEWTKNIQDLIEELRN